MQLWNDYEGRTIAEVYPLNKLVRPEGRSAFFLTTNGTGTPSMVRVIEAHFDESEILKRWSLISEIKQENLVAMKKFGETELDGTPLVYAVMEPTEISLAEVLQNRTLTVDEAKQLASSLVGALQALHERNLIHDHIEPGNILAAGEIVKLRSDCVREVITDPEMGAPSVTEQKARDAHALAVVLLQALTGRRMLQGSATLLPTPFDGIIRNGLSGKWGLPEMAAALGPVKPAQAAAAVVKPQSQPVKPVASKPASVPAAKVEVPTVAPETKTAPVVETNPTVAPEAKAPAAPVAATVVAPVATKPLMEPVKRPGPPAQPIAKSAIPVQAPDVRHRIVRPVEADPRRTRLWVAGAVGLVLLLLLFWRMTRSEPANNAKAAAAPITTLGPLKTGEVPGAPATTPTPAAKPTPAGKTMAGKETGNGVAPGRTQWRVVAYTFNKENQAQQKADALAKRNPSLSPQVFTPNGRAPYLVTVGGPMTREQAEAFKRKALSAGLPHDLYAQNYAH